MPDLKVLFILALALVPGACGEWIYRLAVGVKWGESQWTFALRLFGFTIGGFCVYSLFGLLGAPEPSYLLPVLFSTPPVGGFTTLVLSTPPIAFGYLGHCASGAAVGLLAGLLMRRFSGRPCSWDVFVDRCRGHMIAVTLQNGEAYVGFADAFDITVERGERDMILTEPAIYVDELKDYRALPYQHIFLRADQIYCIAAIHDPATDRRVTEVGKSPFPSAEPITTDADPPSPS